MRLRIGREELADAVTWAARTLPSRPIIPILAGILIEAGDDRLTLSCFDYEVSARVVADAAVAEPGRALVSGRLLAEIARSLPKQRADLTSSGDSVVLNCGSARFTLLALPVEDFPALPPMPPPVGTVDGGEFATAVGQVAVAAGRDDTLPMLTGVLVEIDGTAMTLVATDRYRMSVRELGWRPAQPGVRASALVPARTLADAAKTMTAGTDVVISLGPAEGDGPAQDAGLDTGTGTHDAAGTGSSAADATGGLVGFDDGGRRMTARLLGTEFVSYKSRFPREFGCQARLAAGPFGDAIRRVSLVADRDARLLLTFGADHVVIETGSSDGSGAVETVDAEFEGEDGFTIAFKPQYLLDGIGAAAGGQARAARPAGVGAGAGAATAAGGDAASGRVELAGDAAPGGSGELAGDAAASGRVELAGDAAPGGSGEPAGDAAPGGRAETAERQRDVTLQFTTPDKPAVIMGCPGFKYLLAPMRT